jgi:chromosome segregation ATPase
MALTRAFLKSLGLDEDKVTSIIEAHTETISGLKSEKAALEQQLADAQKDGETLKTVQKELDDLKKDDYKGKYESEKQAHEDLKATVQKDKDRAAKETAVRAYYEAKNIKGANQAIAMRGTNLDALELDDKGAIKDTSALDALVAGDFKPLTAGARVVDSGGALGNPDNGGSNKPLSLNAALREAYKEK